MGRGIGYVLAHEQFPPQEIVDLAVAAEEAGFDGVWASDHFHPWQDNQGHCGHAWITLAAIGQRTSRVRFGTGVTCPIYRYRPANVAQAFATLAALHPGRVFLGLGTGEALNEIPAGGGWGPYREREARLREAIALIRRLWAGEWVDSEGPHFPARTARLYTTPPSPVPVYVAASGPKSAALAGELADGWITIADLVPPRAAVARALRDGAAASGRDARDLPMLVELYAVVGDERDALAAAGLWLFGPVMLDVIDEFDPRVIQRRAGELTTPAQVMAPWVVSERPEPHVERLEALFAAGASEVYVHFPQEDQRRAIEFYGREVLPRVRGRTGGN